MITHALFLFHHGTLDPWQVVRVLLVGCSPNHIPKFFMAGVRVVCSIAVKVKRGIFFGARSRAEKIYAALSLNREARCTSTAPAVLLTLNIFRATPRVNAPCA